MSASGQVRTKYVEQFNELVKILQNFLQVANLVFSDEDIRLSHIAALRSILESLPFLYPLGARELAVYPDRVELILQPSSDKQWIFEVKKDVLNPYVHYVTIYWVNPSGIVRSLIKDFFKNYGYPVGEIFRNWRDVAVGIWHYLDLGEPEGIAIRVRSQGFEESYSKNLVPVLFTRTYSYFSRFDIFKALSELARRTSQTYRQLKVEEYWSEIDEESQRSPQ